MHSVKVLSLLALVGATVAQPRARGNGHKKVIYETFLETVYTTVTADEPAPSVAPMDGSAPAPEPIFTAPVFPTVRPIFSRSSVVLEPSSTVAPMPVVTSSVAPIPVVTSSVAPVPVITSVAPVPVVTSEAPAPVVSTTSEAPAPVVTSTPTSTSAAPAATATASGYMAIVDEWCVKLGRSKFNVNPTLVANALKTAVDGNGQMVHELNPGSYGQVLAPGTPDDFLHVFVGGWLCERPALPGLDGICTTQSVGWTYEGQTGHADIIMNADYHSIGCANSGGIWACDFAFDA